MAFIKSSFFAPFSVWSGPQNRVFVDNWSSSAGCWPSKRVNNNNNNNNNNDHFMALCLGLPGWAGTRKTLTHPPSWSSSNLYQLLQITYLFATITKICSQGFDAHCGDLPRVKQSKYWRKLTSLSHKFGKHPINLILSSWVSAMQVHQNIYTARQSFNLSYSNSTKSSAVKQNLSK